MTINYVQLNSKYEHKMKWKSQTLHRDIGTGTGSGINTRIVTDTDTYSYIKIHKSTAITISFSWFIHNSSTNTNSHSHSQSQSQFDLLFILHTNAYNRWFKNIILYVSCLHKNVVKMLQFFFFFLFALVASSLIISLPCLRDLFLLAQNTNWKTMIKSKISTSDWFISEQQRREKRNETNKSIQREKMFRLKWFRNSIR